MLEQLEQYAPERKRDFALLKLHYDLGCYVNYAKSNPSKQTGGSRLHRWYEVSGDELNILKTVLAEAKNGRRQ